MSSPSAQREIKTYLKKLQGHGWSVEKTPRHYKMRSPSGQLFVASSTPSCPHAASAIERNIRKCIKDRSEFVPFKTLPKKERDMFANKPRLIEESEPLPQPEQPAAVTDPTPIEKATFKALDADALDFCLDAVKEGWTQARIAEALSSMGYRGPRGSMIAQKNISTFMITNGHRQLQRNQIIEKLKDSKPLILTAPISDQYKITLPPNVSVDLDRLTVETPKSPVEKLKFESDFLREIHEILNSPLSEQLKEKILQRCFCSN